VRKVWSYNLSIEATLAAKSSASASDCSIEEEAVMEAWIITVEKQSQIV
jgi:hypothetical protein